MEAAVGDRLHIHGHNVGDPDKMGEILEVHGKAGEPPYVVRFDDGHTGLVFPGPDAVIEHPSRGSRGNGASKAAPARKAAPTRKAAPAGKSSAAPRKKRAR
jgi:Domain of unknown function (DUF1918)